MSDSNNDDPPPRPPPPHVREGCECRTIQPSPEAIQMITARGGTVILGISTGDTDKLNLYVKENDGKTAYIFLICPDQHAICSPDSRAITTCQLMRIAIVLGKIYVDEVQAELCFWLAGLCLPAGRSNSASERAEIQRQAYDTRHIK